MHSPMIFFDMVVAADEAGGIGNKGELPWKLPRDVAFFQRITSECEQPGCQNVVIMGRKTWDTIPTRFRPLSRRLNVVLTRQQAYQAEEALVLSDLDKALEAVAAREDVARVFVIGGGEIYRLGALHPRCRRVYLTRVEGRFDCDARFPQLGPEFSLTDASERHEENGVGYVFQTWERDLG
jgi:dihydrofolate reductase